MKVLVIGGGIAGTAAVYRAVRRGDICVWIHTGLGASSASSGALDWEPYGQRAAMHAQAPQLSVELLEFARDVCAWQLPDQGVLVVNETGTLRRARGCDHGVLDLGALQGGVVAVLQCARPGWDASRVCLTLNDEPSLQRQGLRAVPLALDLTQLLGAEAGLERVLGDLQFARLLTSPVLMQRLAAALAQAIAAVGERPRAILTGPWLFAEPGAREALERALGEAGAALTIAETLSPAYGLAGLRFEALRAQWAGAQARVAQLRSKAVRVQQCDAGWRVHVEHSEEAWDADLCVLALGGVAGGGLSLDAEHRVALALDVGAGQLRLGGKPWLQSASETGIDVQALGMDVLANLGFASSERSLRIAGDLAPDQPRTVLRAAQSGLDALQ